MRILFTLLLCICASEGLRTQTSLQYAVDFTATDTDGKTHVLFDYLDDNKHVLMCFLYSTCSPCTTAIEPLVQVYHDMGCNMGELIVLSVNYNESNETVIAFQQDNYFPIPYISGEQGGNAVFFTYQIQTFPTVILIRPDGYILNQDIYPVSIPNLQHALFQQAGLSPKYDVCPIPVVSAGEASEQAEIWELFPNPASEWTQLRGSFMHRTPASATLQLYDVQGSLVHHWIKHDVDSGEIFLSLNGIPSGLYFLFIQQVEKKPISLPLQIVR